MNVCLSTLNQIVNDFHVNHSINTHIYMHEREMVIKFYLAVFLCFGANIPLPCYPDFKHLYISDLLGLEGHGPRNEVNDTHL